MGDDKLNVKTLGPNSGYSILRIVIDPNKDPRGPKMLFKPFVNSYLEKRDIKKANMPTP